MRQWLTLGLGPLTALPGLLSWILGEVRGKKVREKGKRKGCKNKRWQNRTRPRLGKKSTPMITIITTHTPV